jgi:purine-binding chemotaxis protein CheW
MANLARRSPQGSGSQKRAQQLDRGPRTEYLAFKLAGEIYAAPVTLIREILKPPMLTPVPRAPPAVMGIVSVRGPVVTVVDLRRRLRLPEMPNTNRTRILLVNATGGETLGLFVDEVLQVYRLADSEIESAAAALGGDVAPYISGIARPKHAMGVGPSSGTKTMAGTVTAEASVIILLDLRAVLSA